MARPLFMYHDGGIGEGRGEITNAAGMIKMDMGYHDRGQIRGIDTKLAK
jgi:hypothetical protein